MKSLIPTVMPGQVVPYGLFWHIDSYDHKRRFCIFFKIPFYYRAKDSSRWFNKDPRSLEIFGCPAIRIRFFKNFDFFKWVPDENFAKDMINQDPVTGLTLMDRWADAAADQICKVIDKDLFEKMYLQQPVIEKE